MDARESPDSTHKDEPITAEEMETMIDQWAASRAKQLADNIGKQGRQISIRTAAFDMAAQPLLDGRATRSRVHLFAVSCGMSPPISAFLPRILAVRMTLP